MVESRAKNNSITPSDEELVRRSLAGDESGFEMLVDRYKGLLTLVAYRQVRDSSEAEDIAQEALVRAFVSLSSLEKPNRFKAWSVRIATNIGRDHLRKKGRNSMSLDDSRFDERNVKGPARKSVSMEMMALEAREQILEAIQELPEEYEIPIIMRYVEGLSYKEISKRIGIREDTLRKRVHRANMVLREKLKIILGNP